MWCGCRWDDVAVSLVGLRRAVGFVLFLPARDEALEARGAEWLGEGIALEDVGFELGDDAGVLVCLDALGNYANAHRMTNVDNRGDELTLAFGLDHGHHQLAVDLQTPRTQLQQA